MEIHYVPSNSGTLSNTIYSIGKYEAFRFNMGSTLLSLTDFQNVGLATSFFLPPVHSVNTEPYTITKSRFTRFCFIACYSFYTWFIPSLADSSYL